MAFSSRIIALGLALSSLAIAAPTVPSEHVVQKGQTLAKIAKRYNVDLDTMCELNGLKKSDRLQPGTRLQLPDDDDDVDTVQRKAGRVQTAKRGEVDHHAAARTSYAQYLTRPAKRGWVHVMGHHGEWKGQLVGKSGKLQPKSVAALSRLLAWPRTDFAMDKRLLTLLAQVSDAFGGRTLRVVSGYRTTSYASESKHPLGRACDFHVLGVPNNALRDFVRTFDSVGVGYYPNSTFVHLDVRDHDAFWIDYAGPGEPPRSTPYRLAKRTKDANGASERATAVVKDDDEPVDPEAADDMQSRRSEQESSSSSSAGPTSKSTGPQSRFGISPGQRNYSSGSAGVTAERESAGGPVTRAHTSEASL